MDLVRRILLVLGRFLRYSVDFLMGLAVTVVFGGKGKAVPICEDPRLLMPAHVLAALIRKGEVTSEAVVRAYIRRIRVVNPLLNAVVEERFEAALAEARDVDRQIRTGHTPLEEMERETPFLGVPITVKENFQVTGMRQTVGVVVRRNRRADSDADAVVLVRRAGAIILGTTNVSELCSSWETNNKVYGRTNNPYDNKRIAGGSSGGEGSIIGAAGSVMGIGSDIGGSIRLPAMFCGVFGHKPTWGVVSNKGSEPVLNEVLDRYLVTGPLCRYASDLRPLYKVLAGPAHEATLRLDEPVDLGKVRVFYLDEDLGEPIVNAVQAEIKCAVKQALYHLEFTFGSRPERLNLVQLRSVVGMFLTIYVAESKCAMKEKLNKATGKTIGLTLEFLKWLVGHSEHTFMPLALSTLEVSLKWHAGISYPRAHQLRKELVQNLESVLGRDGVLLCPTHPTTAVRHTQPVAQFLNMIYTATFSLVGMPSTHCPLGLASNGLPVGVQVVAARHQDRLTLAVAEALEAGLGGWICPGTDPQSHFLQMFHHP